MEVSKTDIKALDSVTFDCYQGEITLVLGDNGAGKTTLMHIVAGMIGTTFGAVFVNGINVAHRVMEHHEDLALCTQENIYFKYLTVKENISFFKKLHRNKPDEDQPDFTLDQLLKKLKLYDVADNYGSQLSSGTLRCLQVACVLAVSPDVLVLDEPTTGMDVEVKHRLWDMLFVRTSSLPSTSFRPQIILSKKVCKDVCMLRFNANFTERVEMKYGIDID